MGKCPKCQYVDPYADLEKQTIAKENLQLKAQVERLQNELAFKSYQTNGTGNFSPYN